MSRNPPGLCPDGGDQLQQSHKQVALTPLGRNMGPCMSARWGVGGGRYLVNFLELRCLRETSCEGKRRKMTKWRRSGNFRQREMYVQRPCG